MRKDALAKDIFISRVKKELYALREELVAVKSNHSEELDWFREGAKSSITTIVL